MAEPILVMLQLLQSAMHQVVGCAAGRAEMFGQLRKGPVLIEVELAGLQLAISQKRSVNIKEPLLLPPRFGGFRCQGQSLDILPVTPTAPTPSRFGRTWPLCFVATETIRWP